MVRALGDQQSVECETPLALPVDDSSTITRVLQPRSDFPAELLIDANALFVEVYTFETELDEDTARAQPAFLVDARLRESGGSLVEDGMVASAIVHDDDELDVRLCVDPSPNGVTLTPGRYKATITFNDVRIPKTTVSTAVVITEPDKSGFWIVVVLVGIVMLLLLPLPIVVGSLSATRSVRAELRAARWLLAGLALVCLVGYAVATWVYTETAVYETWRASSGSDLRNFVYHGYRGAAAACGIVGGALGLMPKARELLTKTVSQAPVTPPEPAVVPSKLTPAQPPREGRRGRALWIATAVVVVAFVGTALLSNRSAPVAVPPDTIGQADTTSDDDFDETVPLTDPPPATLPATLPATSPPATSPPVSFPSTIVPESTDPSTTSGPPTTTDSPDTLPPQVVTLDVLLVDAEAGSTSGDDIITLLLDEGFSVAAYGVCSDAGTTPGVLRQIRDSRTGDELLGTAGLARDAAEVEPPAALDVVLASKERCDE